MCSSGGKIDHKINNGGTPYCFKVKGQNLHLLGSMLPTDGESPKFCQVYIYDTENELENRMNLIGGCRDKIDESIVEALMDMLNQHNELVRQFHTARLTLHLSGHLWQQYVVDAFCAIEQYRLDLVTNHQKTIRYMSQHFKDALALCRAIGHPSLFLTMTCNTKWPEITEMMKSLSGVDDLPHMHMLIWLHPDARPKTVAQIDALVSAEIPDKYTDPVGYAAVSRYMIHGPCEVDNTYSPFMVKGKCMRLFPKRFNGNTYIDDCSFPIYHKCYTGRSHDTATMVLKNKSTPDSSVLKKQSCLNEVKQSFDSRYVCASEAAWRIFGFDVHSRLLSVDRLPIHLPGNKYVSFRTDFTYAEFPTHFTWLPRECKWRPRQRGDIVDRLIEVHATGGDLLYLRMLLMRRKGSTLFDELRTVEGHVFESFKEACAAMGLLQNDSQ
ncbi:uncharacterized protein LOC141679438 [Apium graveolens]|uniref:uncharacterized protein LOC141679438 n=1 Tax=Apium graveolens TaxID=4045 RepID=UPI003D798B78